MSSLTKQRGASTSQASSASTRVVPTIRIISPDSPSSSLSSHEEDLESPTRLLLAAVSNALAPLQIRLRKKSSGKSSGKRSNPRSSRFIEHLDGELNDGADDNEDAAAKGVRFEETSGLPHLEPPSSSSSSFSFSSSFSSKNKKEKAQTKADKLQQQLQQHNQHQQLQQPRLRFRIPFMRSPSEATIARSQQHQHESQAPSQPRSSKEGNNNESDSYHHHHHQKSRWSILYQKLKGKGSTTQEELWKEKTRQSVWWC